ncbi:MAG: hypothetical protein JWR00_860 [Rubritepida sp.]|nr:hypothetical protein [Rubritepida sp.]
MLVLALALALVALGVMALSAALYALRPQRLPRWAAALLAPVLVMLAGFALAGWAASQLPPDADALPLLMLLPPFGFALYPPVILALLLWVFCTRMRRK